MIWAAPTEQTFSDAAMVIAVARAAADRDLLARLVRERKALRDVTPAGRRYAAKHPDFVADVEARVAPPRNLAIRPKKKRRR